MLEYLFFRIGGYFEGNKVLLMCNQGGQLSLDYYELSRRNSVSIPHYSATWTKQRSKRWISKFAALHCEEWKDEYCDYSILDGTQWELRYRLEGQDERRISGSNAYPENWDSYLRWISDTVHKLPVKENIDVDQAVNVVIKLTSVIKR